MSDTRDQLGIAPVRAYSTVHEWRPGARSALLWTPVSIVLAVIGLIVFGLPLGLRTGRVSISAGPGDVVIVVLLVAALIFIHEGIHAVAMAAFGARPAFGAVLIGKVMPAVYTTAPAIGSRAASTWSSRSRPRRSCLGSGWPASSRRSGRSS